MLKSSYEIGLTRIIPSTYRKPMDEILDDLENAQEQPKKMDFIKVDDFDDRNDVAVDVVGYSDKEHYAEETKLIEDPEKERQLKKERENNMSEIQVYKPEPIVYDDILECLFCGSAKSFSGYSKMNRNFIFGLSNRNVKVKVEDNSDASDSIDVNKETRKQIEFLEDLDISPKAPKIYSMTVPSSVSHGGKKIAYTMIESSSLHKDYCEKLNMMDEIWVPAHSVKTLMQKSNIYPPIYVMPLGVDVGRYKPNCGIMNFGTSMRTFKFLCLSKYSYRKGFDILLKAYMEEFNGNEDVSLLLVTNPLNTMAGTSGSQMIVDDFNDIKNSVKKSEEELPHIALYTKPTDEKDMPKIYNSCNAFCLISRGEGFSLTVLEAASCGLPVIASNVTAHTDFLKKDNSYLIEPDGLIQSKCGGNMSRMAKLCHFYEGQLFPDFSNTGVSQTREKMREVFENYQEAQVKAEKLRNHVLSNYTWDMAVDKAYHRLKEIS